MKHKWRNILIILGLVIAVILLVDFNRRMEELNRLNTNLAAVRADGTTVMQTQAALVTQVAYATSDDAVEEWAYENGWVREGEHPVRLIPAEAGTVTPVPSSVTRTESVPNWQVWWELFFGAN
jgi:hypothetical protein